jgi:hypothetical protein
MEPIIIIQAYLKKYSVEVKIFASTDLKDIYDMGKAFLN